MTTERDEEAGVHDRARARLFAAEIAAVLDVPVRADETGNDRSHSRFGQWLLAALMLLGVAVAVGVGWLHKDASREAQQPEAFDPVYPRLQEDMPHVPGIVGVEDLAALAALPPHVDAIATRASSPILEVLAGRRGLRLLSIGTGPDGSDPEPTAAALRAIAAIPELEALHLLTTRSPTAEVLRELRMAPKLRTLALGGDGSVPLDRGLAEAIAELPRLQQLLLSRVPLTAAGVRGLSALSDLELLYVDRTAYDDEVFAAFGSLRRLRGLTLWDLGDGGGKPGTLTTARVRSLGAVPRLVELTLSGFYCDEAALAALPTTLHSLRLVNVPGTTAAGLRQLVRLPLLRSLYYDDLNNPEVQGALAEVVKTAPIEQLLMPGTPLTEPLWQALQAQPRLRSLHLPLGGDFDAVAAQLVRLPRLERLFLSYLSLPERAESLRLTELPQLRRLDLVYDGPLKNARAADLTLRLKELLGDRVVIRAR